MNQQQQSCKQQNHEWPTKNTLIIPHKKIVKI